MIRFMGLRNKRPDLNGLLVIDKPLGWTSTRVVTRVRRATGGARVGHAGTLDPLATGVLILCIGKATRLVEKLMAQAKQYVATIDLSRTSESHDLERPTTSVHVVKPPDLRRIESALHGFVGTIMQTPPAHSAVWIDGRRAYDLARAGTLDDQAPRFLPPGADTPARLEPRPVRIDSIGIERFQWPELVIRVNCGKGTYIRSLARDIGRALETGGVLTALVRTRSGGFTLERATGIEQLPARVEPPDLLPMEAADADH